MKNHFERFLRPVARLLPQRVHLLYLILSVLIVLSVGPLLTYGFLVSSSSREKLMTNERELQTRVTRGIAQQVSLYVRSMNMQTENLVRLLESTGAIEDVAAEQYAQTLDRSIESFVGTGVNVLFLTIVNPEQRGRQGGVFEVGKDDFVRTKLSAAFQQAQLGFTFNTQAFNVNHGGRTEPVFVMARPLAVNGDFRGMVAMVISLEFLREQLQEASTGGLVTYVVNKEGELIVHADQEHYTVGQDMRSIRLVQDFMAGIPQAVITTQFKLEEKGELVEMLGTQAAVPELRWAVMAQKPMEQAYFAVHEMQRYAVVLMLLAVLFSVGIGYYSARKLTTPLEILSETTRAIAKGDFSRRVNLPSRTEFGELADTFNLMTDDLEKYVEQLKQAALENHELFLGSIRTLAAAIDEKDPYTRGHSGRVSKYSVILAETLGLEEEEVYKIRISAMLHDVGKIGIDDRILKKPTGLTSEEFEIMKQHPVKGANIIRPVAKLREMIPGIELHHESLDGHGYPYGLKGDELPPMARIIMVADTLDAMTTNRPYQAAMELEVAMDKIRSLQEKKFDPEVVDALFTAVAAKRLRVTPQMVQV